MKPTLHFSLCPSEAFYVSADESVVPLIASIFVEGEGEALCEIPINQATIDWEIIEGAAGKLDLHQSSAEGGYSTNKLLTSTAAGMTYRVQAKLVHWTHGECSSDYAPGAEPILVSGQISVVAGDCAGFCLTSDRETLPADGKSCILWTAHSPVDAFNNPVADGEPVSWRLERHGTLLRQENEMTHRGATALVQTGTFPSILKITVQVGGHTQSASVPISNLAIDLAVSASSLDLATHATAVLEAKLSSADGGIAAGDVEIKWFTSNGQIAENRTGHSSSRVMLSTEGGRLGSSLVAAIAANSVAWRRIEYYSSASLKVSVTHPVLAGDAVADGSEEHERLDGSKRLETYHASTAVIVTGAPHQEVDVRLRGIAAPHFQLSGLKDTGKLILDADGRGSALVSSKGTLFDAIAPKALPKFEVCVACSTTPHVKSAILIHPAPRAWITSIKNLTRSFVWGEVENLAEEIVAGVLCHTAGQQILTDIGNLTPAGDETNWSQFGFALCDVMSSPSVAGSRKGSLIANLFSGISNLFRRPADSK